jgi:prepilin-type N-terminal cleavage/methylation domain-containing protein
MFRPNSRLAGVVACSLAWQATRRTARCGFTLAELLVATAVTTILVMAIGALTLAVQSGSQYSYEESLATQHARVSIERIEQAVQGAAATLESPGFVALEETVGSWRFPDTLVVWKADSNDDSIPQVGELVVFCPNPDDPSQLVEISDPGNGSTVPALSDTSAIQTVIDALKVGANSTKTVLTPLLRTASISASEAPRGAIRFEVRWQPTAEQWAEFVAGDTEWSQLPWAQGIHSNSTGLRQAWMRCELQLLPTESEVVALPDARTVTFFGSAALYYQVTKP